MGDKAGGGGGGSLPGPVQRQQAEGNEEALPVGMVSQPS